MAAGLFSFLDPCAVQPRRLACKSGSGPYVFETRGAAQAADFNKSPDRQRKTRQRQYVMQHCPRRCRNPCSFRKLAERAGHQVEHDEPPGALVAIMQPLGGD